MAGMPPAHSNSVGGGGGGLDGDRAGMSSPRLVDSELSAPGRIRTSDQQLRRLLLYPPELRAPEQLRQFCDSQCLPLVRQTSSCQPLTSTARSDTPRRTRVL